MSGTFSLYVCKFVLAGFRCVRAREMVEMEALTSLISNNFCWISGINESLDRADTVIAEDARTTSLQRTIYTGIVVSRRDNLNQPSILCLVGQCQFRRARFCPSPPPISSTLSAPPPVASLYTLTVFGARPLSRSRWLIMLALGPGPGSNFDIWFERLAKITKHPAQLHVDINRELLQRIFTRLYGFSNIGDGGNYGALAWLIQGYGKSRRMRIAIFGFIFKADTTWLDLTEANPLPPLDTIKKQVTISAMEACKHAEAMLIATEWKEFREIDWEEVYAEGGLSIGFGAGPGSWSLIFFSIQSGIKFFGVFAPGKERGSTLSQANLRLWVGYPGVRPVRV
ncbi:hypothetical protein BYT27DRAFT_7209246 [Phlegmacium glaucopus]|nr:hypothetical protein BYT27DRAFT_7209246 [Phlegmacium glaucopus]